MGKGARGGRGAVGNQAVSAKIGGIQKAVDELLAAQHLNPGETGPRIIDQAKLSPEAYDAALGITLFTAGNVATVLNPSIWAANKASPVINEWLVGTDKDHLGHNRIFRSDGSKAHYEKANRTVTAMAKTKLKVPIPVQRGMAIENHLAAGLKVGDTFTFRAAASSSKNTHTADSFARTERSRQGNDKFSEVVFSFNAKRGTDISQLSHYRSEAEVIVGGRVKITSVTKVGTVYYVKAEQLSR